MLEKSNTTTPMAPAKGGARLVISVLASVPTIRWDETLPFDAPSLAELQPAEAMVIISLVVVVILCVAYLLWSFWPTALRARRRQRLGQPRASGPSLELLQAITGKSFPLPQRKTIIRHGSTNPAPPVARSALEQTLPTPAQNGTAQDSRLFDESTDQPSLAQARHDEGLLRSWSTPPITPARFLEAYNKAVCRLDASLFLSDQSIQRSLGYYVKSANGLQECDPPLAQFWCVIFDSVYGFAVPSIEYFLENMSAFSSGESRSGARALLAPVFELETEGAANPTLDEPAEVVANSGGGSLSVIKPGRLRW